MGETRVDLLHLLEDLRDAYPGALEETILTEIVANSLDSGASVVSISTDAANSTVTVTDDGSGMSRRDLRRFHDIAATTKTRGRGIGFAGVGIKLGLLASEEVLTETRRGASHIATAWHLASRHKAPWKWVPPPGLVAEHGTAVRLRLREPLSALLDPGFVEAALRRHFLPLLDAAFDDLLRVHYPGLVTFVVNGREPARTGPPKGAAPVAVRIGRKRKPSAVGYVFRSPAPLSEDARGVAVSTLGKIIKRGWEWLGLSPAAPELAGGVVEVPALAECLTLNKADFVRAGPRGQTFLTYRRAIQQAVGARLSEWGETGADADEARRRKTRPLERDLQTVLVDLAEDFPLLAALVERQAGGQRRLPIGRSGDGKPAGTGLLGDSLLTAERSSEPAPQEPGTPGESAPEPPPAAVLPERLPAATRRGPRRPAHYALSIRFESRPDSSQLSRLVETAVWVNEAHPAYRRAQASRSEGYHVALSVAMAIAPEAVEPAQAHAFVTAFLTRWGEALERGKRRVRP